MLALRDLVQRARAGGLRSSDLTDPTTTVISLGERGAESVLGVIHPPQVAIVGFGRVVERPWVVDDQVVARALAATTLAADHRASDGHLGGQLLAGIAPEADLATIGDTEHLREVLDLDSMDFLNFLIALGEKSGRKIPEADAPKLYTLKGLIAYLAR